MSLWMFFILVTTISFFTYKKITCLLESSLTLRSNCLYSSAKSCSRYSNLLTALLKLISLIRLEVIFIYLNSCRRGSTYFSDPFLLLLDSSTFLFTIITFAYFDDICLLNVICVAKIQNYEGNF